MQYRCVEACRDALVRSPPLTYAMGVWWRLARLASDAVRIALALGVAALGAALAVHLWSRPTAPKGWTCYVPPCESHASGQEPPAISLATGGVVLVAGMLGLVGYRRFNGRQR